MQTDLVRFGLTTVESKKLDHKYEGMWVSVVLEWEGYWLAVGGSEGLQGGGYAMRWGVGVCDEPII